MKRIGVTLSTVTALVLGAAAFAREPEFHQRFLRIALRSYRQIVGARQNCAHSHKLDEQQQNQIDTYGISKTDPHLRSARRRRHDGCAFRPSTNTISRSPLLARVKSLYLMHPLFMLVGGW